jgi:hypothetical protein
VLEDLVGTSGWMQLAQLKIQTFQEEDYLLAFGVSDSFGPLDSRIIPRFFSLSAEVLSNPALSKETMTSLQKGIDEEKENAIRDSQDRNGKYFQEEYEKLDFWAEDMKLSLEKEIKDLDSEIKLKKSESRRVMDLKEKVNLQRQIKDLEKSRNDKRRKLFESQDEIDEKKEKLLNDIERQMNQHQQLFPLFTVRWELK